MRAPGVHARRTGPAPPGLASDGAPPGRALDQSTSGRLTAGVGPVPASARSAGSGPPAGPGASPGGPGERGAGVPAAEVLDEVRALLVAGGGPPGPARVAAALRATGRVLGDEELLAVVSTLQAELNGAGPLQPLLTAPGVSDVLVNAPDSVWTDCGRGLVRAAVRFPDETAVRRLAQRMAAQAGRRLDDSVPWVDARLPDGTRLHAVLPPVAVAGTTISLRVPARRTFTLADLVETGALPAAGARLLTQLVRARCSFVVSGGTGTGKTTLLSCLLATADPGERIVVVEDSRELDPAHPHVVHLESRPANVEGQGAVGMQQLVRQALRMRPDRVVVGEVRGAEVTEMLAAMNTGHEGGCGTVHANSAADVPARIEALAGVGGLARDAAHSQLASALEVVVHLVRLRDGARRVAEVHVVARGSDGWVHTVPAVTCGRDGLQRGPGAERLDRLLDRGGPWTP